MLVFLRRKATFVKPLAKDTELFGWQHSTMTYAEAFTDDLRRYGFRVAIYNIVWLWRNR